MGGNKIMFTYDLSKFYNTFSYPRVAYNKLGGNNTPKNVKTKYVIFSNFSVIFWNIVVETIIIIIIIIIIIVIIIVIIITIIIIIIIIVIVIIIIIIIILNRVIFLSISIWRSYI